MRMKPESVKRSPASIQSGLNFGKASKLGRQIRTLIAPINPSNTNSHSSNLFTGALTRFINWREKQNVSSLVLQKELPFIGGFQFNNLSSLASISAIRVSIGTSEAGSPEFRFASFVPGEALHASFYTDHIIFKIIFTSSNLTDLTSEKIGTTDIEIPYSTEIFQPPVIPMPSSATPGNLIIMVLAVQYWVNRKIVVMQTDLKKLPCGIVWAGWI